MIKQLKTAQIRRYYPSMTSAIRYVIGLIAASILIAGTTLALRPADPLAKFSDQDIQAAARTIIGDYPTCANSIPEGCKSALDRIATDRARYANYQPTRLRKAIIGMYDAAEDKAKQDHEAEMQRYRAQDVLNVAAAINRPVKP